MVTMGASSKASERPDHTIRINEVATTPHTSRGKHKGGSTGHSSDGRIRIATNLMDVPAELISKRFRLRWMIELFFRMIKGLLTCSHLLSTKQNGVEIQAYMAVIACLLIVIYTSADLFLYNWTGVERQTL